MKKRGYKNILSYINLFDILFVLLIIVLVFVCYYRFFLSKDKQVFEINNKIIYTAKVENVPKDTVDNIKIDDLIFKGTTLKNEYRKIGKITNIEIEPYKVIQFNSDGTSDNIEFPGSYNIILTIEEDGKFSEGNYYSSTNESLYSNSIVSAATKYVKFEMKIQNIEEDK